MLVVHFITGIAIILYRYLQGYFMLICIQHHMLKTLVLNIYKKVDIVGRFSEAHCGAINKAIHQVSESHDYIVSFVAVRGFMEDLDLFFRYSFAAMNNNNHDT